MIIAMIDFNKILTNLLFGFSVLFMSGPTLGEMIATMAPIYPKKDDLLVNGLGIRYQKVSFQSSDGKTLRGWFFPSNEAESPAILYAPATAKDQRSGISLVAPLHQAGYHVLLFSYRGHGRSEGDRFGFTYGANESRDIDAAVAFLSEVKGIGQIGVIGHSAGAASGIISAARNPQISAVVAASPFPSLEDAWYKNRPKFIPKPIFELLFRFTEHRKRFSRNQVRPHEVIGQISPRSLLIIHGIDDRRITQRQAMDLFDKANEPKHMWLVAGASHAEVRAPVLDLHLQDIIAFFKQAFGSFTQPKCGVQFKSL
jgi:dipeptidyl aminopeptidase/acylaminoacyl peptidase